MNIQKVCLIGAGAVGAALASIITDQRSADLTIIVDEERAARYRSSGFVVNKNQYEFSFVIPGNISSPFDLVIIATKGHHLEGAIELLRPAVGNQTIIISLINGISSEEMLEAAFPEAIVLPAMILGIDAVRTSTTVLYANKGTIYFGAPTGEADKEKADSRRQLQADAVDAVRGFMEASQLPYSVPEDIYRILWWKFLVNVGINQVSAVLMSSYGEFQHDGEARRLMLDAQQEVLVIAEPAGIFLTEGDIDNWLSVLEGLSPEGKTSMLQDFEAQRKTEVELFAGTVVRLGRRFGVATPINKMLFRLIRAKEEQWGVS